MTLCKKYMHGRQRTEWGGCWQHHPKKHPSVECPWAFAQTYDEGVWKLLGDAWLALLLPVGSVCRAMASGSAFLVLRTCEHGAEVFLNITQTRSS